MSVYAKMIKVNKTIQGQRVLCDINLEFHQGKIYGLQGKNGSGKTMLLRALCGLIIPNSGEVIVNNQTLNAKHSFPESVGILIEYPGFLPQYTGFRNLQLLASIKKQINDDQIRESLLWVGLQPEDKRKYKKYSLGMKQRLGIAQAIMEDPELLLLDEPTNALDSDAVESMRDLLLNLKNKGKTIIVASHDREEIDYLADEKIILENGRVTSIEVIS
ncbi:ATP-binding cassette domain-containing protein [Paenibacillus larvae]|uniref:ATP-binding cassette domain-containing protein n=1 Tax=Paenibacillus larvae TaxID=1464 RepID=UPI00227E2CF0|nr:ATP-binding cassette domain-containing protein [Paenibacillus larvae]MCY9512495.1 ATP-binding cassette domain-containing protein [Paenibacillus larvae]MCY9526772.1 ATP-binding cassette domain-containing protein [Paenibacillus larvae]